MSRLGSVRRTALVTGLGTVAAIAATGLLATAPAQAAGSPDPYSPSYHHTYRHGAVPTQETNSKMKAWQHANAAATGPKTLSYGGGVDGIGVNSGHAKVYLVFYGTQWGTQTTTNGVSSFSGDANHAAEAAQNMFKGIGTNNERWSADLTQWCDGPNVASGATSCPSNANFIPYQSGGVLSGVWYDNSKASPSSATALQLGQEAVTAAGHFGNTTAASNRNAYYVILSPHGTNPDNYQSPTQGYCAWHDWNGDVGATSSYGDIAFSNQPYNIDMGSSCGTNFINSGSAGTLDGYTMTLGHEWQEMMSDQNPAGGWTNHTGGSFDGQENSDECAWIAAGSTGGAANIAFATGTFAEQASWSNDTNDCSISHAIVGGGSTGNTVTVTNPGSQTGTVGTAKSLQMSGSDSASGQTLTWSATGLPAGLSISSSTGLISGTPTTAATYSTTVTATDSTGAAGSASFSFTIGSGSTGGCSGQLLGNPGFETGTAAPWTASSGVVDNSTGEAARSGSWKAWMDGYGSTHTDTLSQTVSIPAGCTATLGYYVHIDTKETGTTAYDKLTVAVNGTTKATYSNVNAASGYALHTLSLSSYAGTSVTIKFTGTEDSSLATSFVIDDTSLNLG